MNQNVVAAGVSRREVHTTIGAGGLVLLGANINNNGFAIATNGTDFLRSTDPLDDSFGGVEGNLTRRNANGRGFEARYFGLFGSDRSNSLTGAGNSTLVGLENINTSAGSADVLFSNPNAIQTVTQGIDVNNAEFNRLLCGIGSGFLGRRAIINESLFGFRYFNLGHDLAYLADLRSVPDGGVFYNAYDVNVDNKLYGFQLGRRLELPFFGRFRLISSVKFGVFNNNVTTGQRITRQDANRRVIETGNFFGPDGHTDFDVGGEENELAFLGELEAGLVYQISPRVRLRGGYRLLGADGIATVEDQIPASFNDLSGTSNVVTNGNIVLHGGFFGLEIAR